MGLDQFIYAKTSDWRNYFKDFLKGTKYEGKRLQEMNFEGAYFRKNNAIHKYFVDNIQDGEDDCEEYYITKKDLKDLLKIISGVLSKNLKPEENLPNQSGFFYGSIEYGEHYFDNLKDAKNQIEDILKKYDDDFDFYYSSSW